MGDIESQIYDATLIEVISQGLGNIKMPDVLIVVSLDIWQEIVGQAFQERMAFPEIVQKEDPSLLEYAEGMA